MIYTETVKERVTRLLRDNKSEYISGERIAESLGVSRAAVWKAVTALKNDGFNIEAVTNRGYRLISANDELDAAVITCLLNDDAACCRINTADTVSSTNVLACEKAAQGKAEGWFIVSGEQTKGRGRMGRSFFSPPDSGVYMSLLLRPSIPPEKAVFITTAAAVSVCEALEKLGCEKPLIKWVNDIFVNGKKISGILTQASVGLESGKLDWAVLGVGVNIYKPENGFPGDIDSIAGAVFSKREEDLRNRFAAFFLNSFFKYYKNIDTKSHSEEYIRRSFIIGKEVTAVSGESTKKCKVLGIDDECRLSVMYDDGTKELLSSGEISLKLN